MESRILKLLERAEYTPSNVPELLRQLHLRPNQQQELQQALRTMESRGLILRTKGNRYIQARAADMVPGIIQVTRGGRGFLQPDEPGVSEIAIAVPAMGTAMHGDRVLVRRDVKPRGLRQPAIEESTGEVIRILERKRTRFVGTFQRRGPLLHVIPDDPRLPRLVYVAKPADTGRSARPGDKVVVELVQWESRESPPEGHVIEVLGPADEEGVDMLSVLRQYALPLHFPKTVLHDANAIAKAHPDHQPGAAECVGRVDCRTHDVITIDPDDAKDFDDAIGLQRRGHDRWTLHVHIADVSHYVRPGSALDTEARKRGNSTYLVDRVIPMLPEALSNDLCSLKPDVDRLTKCVEFQLSNDGAVVQTKFYSAVIRSKRRFTYQEAFAVLQREPADGLERMLHAAHAIAQRVRERRFQNGSLDLEFPENKIRLDEHGRVRCIERLENDSSHQLIEEFMLLANEAVAARLMSLQRPSVYRIHEPPKEKRLNDFREDVLSHRIPCGDLNHRPEVQRLLARLDTLPVGPALKIGFLKSLMRARYASEPVGHYGLAKTKYTHFTSPIRRYSDLVVHRSLFEKVPSAAAGMSEVAAHLSTTERNSADAERDSREVKLYAYLKAQLAAKNPLPYAAIVTDVRNFGFFVDVPDLGLSGLVHLSMMPDDFFDFDPVRGQLTGRHTRRVIQHGNKVTVQISRVDSFKKQVDFQLVETAAKGTPGPVQERTRTGGRGAAPAAHKSRRSSHGEPQRERPGRAAARGRIQKREGPRQKREAPAGPWKKQKRG